MDLVEIKETEVWDLYRRSVNYCRRMSMYSDTDKNYNFYNGNHWEGLIVKGIEPVQYNFIKPIVKYKVGTINSNLWAINYSSENFENKEFRSYAAKVCELLNKRAKRIWEKDNLDKKIRDVSKDSAINDEGIMYVYWNTEDEMPVNEVLNKNDVYYGNENDQEIQKQPYIIVKQRMAVSEAQEFARANGVSEENVRLIIGDKDNLEEAGRLAREEKDDMVTLVTKFYKKDGTIHFAQATKYVDISEDKNTGYKYYPIAHMVWEEKKGSARGEGEVRHLIPNQLETNKTAMRRLITVKNTAYPQKVVNIEKIANPSALNEVGAIIKTKGGMTVDDVAKVFANIPPSQMSPDVKVLQEELIQSTRELAGAGDIATGDVDPESASGRAILAVQQAAQQPLVEQLGALKSFVEDIARIWLDMITVNAAEGINLEEEVTDPTTGEEYIQLIRVDKVTLNELKASVKVDITPKGVFDKYAQEMSIENLLMNGLFSVQRLPELKAYLECLDDDASMPKLKIQEMIEKQEKEQQRIAEINAQAQMMEQRAMQFLMEDPDAQSSQMLEVMGGGVAPQGMTEVPTDDEAAMF